MEALDLARRGHHHALHLCLHHARPRAQGAHPRVLRYPPERLHAGPNAAGGPDYRADLRHSARARLWLPVRRGRHPGRRGPTRSQGDLRRGARLRRQPGRRVRGTAGAGVHVQLSRHEGVSHHRGRGCCHGERGADTEAGACAQLRHHRARRRGIRGRKRQDERVPGRDGPVQPAPCGW